MSDKNKTDAKSNSGSNVQNRRRIFAMMLVIMFSVAAISYLVFESHLSNPEVILGEETLSQPENDTEINVGQIIDVVSDSNTNPKEGYRYRVKIGGMSKDGLSGITHIGGMITFVPGTKEGDVAVVQITSVRRTVANAELISKEDVAAVSSKEPDIPENKIIDLRKTSVQQARAGEIYRGIITDVGRKGDGLIRVGGKVTFIPDTQKGDICIFKVVDKNDRFNRGELIKIENK